MSDFVFAILMLAFIVYVTYTLPLLFESKQRRFLIRKINNLQSQLADAQTIIATNEMKRAQFTRNGLVFENKEVEK